MQKQAWTYSLTGAALGAFALLLRWLQREMIIDEAGLPRSGAAISVLLVLFLLDLIVAFLSRTLPQMNVLLLGFQVKALATIAALPLALSFSGALFARLMRTALETMPRLI